MAELLKSVEDAKAALLTVQGQLENVSNGLADEKKASFEEGKVAGKNEAVAENPDLKVYTEAQMVEIKEKAKLEGIEIGKSGQAEAVRLAVEAKAAEIMSDFESTQVDDAAFLAKHKPAPAPAPEAVPEV